MAAGVYGMDDYAVETQVIDLGNIYAKCQPWADHPTGANWAVGGLTNDGLLICGGQSPSEFPSKKCHLITPTKSIATQSLIIGTLSAGATILANNSLLVTGGWNRGAINNSQLVNNETAFLLPDLPHPVEEHCMIKVSEDVIMLTGGSSGGRKTWYFSFVNERWTEGPEMIDGRSGHTCGSFILNHQQLLVVVGGVLDTYGSQVEFLVAGTENWFKGVFLQMLIFNKPF